MSDTKKTIRVGRKDGRTLNVSIPIWQEINNIKTEKLLKNHDQVIKLLLETYKKHLKT